MRKGSGGVTMDETAAHRATVPALLLVGQYDSPFVRRVAVTLHLYGFDFDRRVLSVFDDFASVLTENPLGKVPMLRLTDGDGVAEPLFDSQIIVDCLDEWAGPERSLTPGCGSARQNGCALPSSDSASARCGFSRLV